MASRRARFKGSSLYSCTQLRGRGRHPVAASIIAPINGDYIDLSTSPSNEIITVTGVCDSHNSSVSFLKAEFSGKPAIFKQIDFCVGNRFSETMDLSSLHLYEDNIAHLEIVNENGESMTSYATGLSFHFKFAQNLNVLIDEGSTLRVGGAEQYKVAISASCDNYYSQTASFWVYVDGNYFTRIDGECTSEGKLLVEIDLSQADAGGSSKLMFQVSQNNIFSDFKTVNLNLRKIENSSIALQYSEDASYATLAISGNCAGDFANVYADVSLNGNMLVNAMNFYCISGEFHGTYDIYLSDTPSGTYPVDVTLYQGQSFETLQSTVNVGPY